MLFEPEPFQSRHIGPDKAEADEMLKVIGASSMEALMDEAIPARIRLPKRLDLSVMRRIPPRLPAVVAAPQRRALADDDRADGHLSARESLRGEAKGFAHPSLVVVAGLSHAR